MFGLGGETTREALRQSSGYLQAPALKANYESAVALHWRTPAGAAPALLSNTVKMRGLNLLANLPERGHAAHRCLNTRHSMPQPI